MRSKTCLILSFLLLFLFCQTSLAQDEEDKLETAWLAKDVQAIDQILPKLKREELQTLSGLETIFGRELSDWEDLGFGACTFRFSRAEGYTTFIVSGFAFDGMIGYYTIQVESSFSWPKIRNHIIEAWNRNSEFQFKENDSGITYKEDYPNVITAYKAIVASELGEIKEVTVPSKLRVEYDYLISLGNSSVVSKVPCDVAGVIPYGKGAIDKLVRSRRVDLIENILRGYDPGGRVYALLALLELKRRGIKISAQARLAMDVIRNLDLQIETCSGCEHSQKQAKEIISSW